MEYLWEYIKDLVNLIVVEPSPAAYVWPEILVQHPEKKPRMVIDYRRLNQYIIIKAVPLPHLHPSFNWFVEPNIS